MLWYNHGDDLTKELYILSLEKMSTTAQLLRYIECIFAYHNVKYRLTEEIIEKMGFMMSIFLRIHTTLDSNCYPLFTILLDFQFLFGYTITPMPVLSFTFRLSWYEIDWISAEYKWNYLIKEVFAHPMLAINLISDAFSFKFQIHSEHFIFQNSMICSL